MPIRREIWDAIDQLSTLSAGDLVTVTEGGRTYDKPMTVYYPLHRSDGQYGSVESSGVSVHWPGGYGTRLAAERMADGKQSFVRFDGSVSE
jgi:hypothetical protein